MDRQNTYEVLSPGTAMLQITSDQMAALQGRGDAQFRQKLSALLREMFPQHAQDQAGVEAVVNVGIADAQDAGLCSERGLAAYVIAAFLLGMEIKNDPRLITALRESGRSEAAKVDWIEHWVTEISAALDS